MIARPASPARFLPLLCLLALSALVSNWSLAAGPQQSAPVEFAGQWGAKGEGPGELAEPAGLAVDLNNRVYIADRRTVVLQKFEDSGVPLFSNGEAAARTVTAIAVDSGGAIYMADARSGRIWIHFPDGDLLRNFRIAPQGAPDASFAFCITAGGKIVVPDGDGARIQVFTPAGRLESAWKLLPSAAGQPARPIAIAAGLDEFVYVADSVGRIAKYTSRGAQSALWEAPPGALGPLRGIGVTRNHVLALRGEKPQLEVWSFDGRRLLVDALGGLVDAPPASLYFAVSRDEQVFVLEAARPRVLRFRLRLPAP